MDGPCCRRPLFCLPLPRRQKPCGKQLGYGRSRNLRLQRAKPGHPQLHLVGPSASGRHGPNRQRTWKANLGLPKASRAPPRRIIFCSTNTEVLETPDAVKVATDQQGQADLLEACCNKLCFGHSSAGYQEPLGFFAKHRGSVMTQTFNGLSGIAHRAKRPTSAAIETDIFMELIPNGIHVDSSGGMMILAKPLILMTDALAANSQRESQHFFGDVKIKVVGGVVRTGSRSPANCTLKFAQAFRDRARCSR